MPAEKIKVSDKYEIIIDWPNNIFKALRHGEEWRDLIEDNLILAMAYEIQELREQACNPISISDLIKEAHQNAIDKGWYEEPRTFGEVIALMHSELSEALEDHRNGRDFREIYCEGDKPCGIPTELADTVIRIFDTCGRLGIDLETAIKVKMAYNASRPHRHGGKRL